MTIVSGSELITVLGDNNLTPKDPKVGGITNIFQGLGVKKSKLIQFILAVFQKRLLRQV